MDDLFREVYGQLTALLHEHEIPFSEEEAEARINEELQYYISFQRNDHDIRAIVRISLRELLPDRYLEYDTERITDPASYTSLIELFAQRTGGEWAPQHIEASLIPEKWRKVRQASVRFDDAKAGAQNWQFSQIDDWVSDTFIEYLTNFTQAYLPNNFGRVKTGDQFAAWVYLPFNVIADLEDLITRLCLQANPYGPPARPALGSMSLCGWDVFDQAGGIAQISHSAQHNAWVMDPGGPLSEQELLTGKRLDQAETDSPIDWEALLAREATQRLSAETAPMLPIMLFSDEHMRLARAAMRRMSLTCSVCIATVLVPFASSKWDIHTTTLNIPDHDPWALSVGTTRGILREWERLPEAEREAAEASFAQRRDPRADALDAPWFLAALVHLARESARLQRPALLLIPSR